MGDVKLFPGVVEVAAVTEPELDLDAILDRYSDLLARWRVFGEELRRRAEHPLPFDLTLELHDLLDESSG